MTEYAEPLKIPDQWICQECKTSMGYILDRRTGTDLTDKEVYSLCVPCFLKRRRAELVVRAEWAVDELRTLGYDAELRVDGEEH